MKRILYLLILFYCLFSFGSCSKEEESIFVGVSNIKIVTEDATEITATAATINGTIQIDGVANLKGYGFYYGSTDNPTKHMAVKLFDRPTETSTLSFKADISNLQAGSIYYFQAYVIDSNNKLIKGEIKKFSTSIIPSLTIISASYEVGNISTLDYNCRFVGEADINYKGNDILEGGFILLDSYNKNKISGEIKNNKIYVDSEYFNNFGGYPQEVYAYVILANKKEYYSPSITMKPNQYYQKDETENPYNGKIEEVITSTATNVSFDAAKLNGSLKIEKRAYVKEYGFFYGTSPNPSLREIVGNFNKPSAIESITFSKELTKLKDGNTYYFQAYAIDQDNNLLKGSELNFTTKKLPSLTIVSASYEVWNAVSTYKSCKFVGEAKIEYTGNDIIEAGFKLVGTDTQQLQGEIKNNRIYVEKEYQNVYGYSAQVVSAYVILADGTIQLSPSIKLQQNQSYP